MSRKLDLAAYSLRLVCAGRPGAAAQVLRNRPLGYDAMDWIALVPGPCRTIVDAGAHTGESAAAMDFAFQPAHLLLVEANPSRADGLCMRFADRPHIQIAAVALAERTGTLPFFLQDFDAASSLSPLRTGYLAARGLPEASRRIDVPARTLADVAGEAGLTEIDLLKLDCQGAELRILQGAGDLLTRIHKIYTEVTFDSAYEQGVRFEELHDFLRANGFHLVQLNAGECSNGNIDQGDALYVRADVP